MHQRESRAKKTCKSVRFSPNSHDGFVMNGNTRIQRSALDCDDLRTRKMATCSWSPLCGLKILEKLPICRVWSQSEHFIFVHGFCVHFTRLITCWYFGKHLWLLKICAVQNLLVFRGHEQSPICSHRPGAKRGTYAWWERNIMHNRCQISSL